MVVVALACAAWATLLGADRPRRQLPATDVAREMLWAVLDRGPGDPGVRGAVIDYRRRVGRSPLDAATRALYAGLLLEMAASRDDARAAVFHARRSAQLAPVTVPVLRLTATVLARCGEREAAASLIRSMFGYEPRRAAGLLGALEPFLPAGALDRESTEGAIPPLARAWVAWSSELAERGRVVESGEWLEATHRRWPDDLAAIEELASRAVYRRDWEALARLLPTGRPLPEVPAAAALFAYRARSAAQRGSTTEAIEDVATAVRLARNDPSVLRVGADALLAAGDPDGARPMYHRALFGLPHDPRSVTARVALLTRLARLEDRHGRPADALRAWRAVLEIDPGHAESRSRVDELTGFQR